MLVVAVLVFVVHWDPPLWPTLIASLLVLPLLVAGFDHFLYLAFVGCFRVEVGTGCSAFKSSNAFWRHAAARPSPSPCLDMAGATHIWLLIQQAHGDGADA